MSVKVIIDIIILLYKAKLIIFDLIMTLIALATHKQVFETALELVSFLSKKYDITIEKKKYYANIITFLFFIATALTIIYKQGYIFPYENDECAIENYYNNKKEEGIDGLRAYIVECATHKKSYIILARAELEKAEYQKAKFCIQKQDNCDPKKCIPSDNNLSEDSIDNLMALAHDQEIKQLCRSKAIPDLETAASNEAVQCIEECGGAACITKFINKFPSSTKITDLEAKSQKPDILSRCAPPPPPPPPPAPVGDISIVEEFNSADKANIVASKIGEILASKFMVVGDSKQSKLTIYLRDMTFESTDTGQSVGNGGQYTEWSGNFKMRVEVHRSQDKQVIWSRPIDEADYGSSESVAIATARKKSIDSAAAALLRELPKYMDK